MAIKSKGRGTAAAFGLLLLFAGLIGGGLLYWSSIQRHDDAVDGFARAAVGCTTTLEFSETGTFYVYEELGTLVEPPDGDCAPISNPLQVFGFELTGESGEVVPRRDDSIRYDTDDYSGDSVARIEISEPGEYEIRVRGDDELTVAAIGRDPDDGVDELRQRAIAVAIAGVVLGVLLLVLAGRRSKHAGEFATPEGPGWGPQRTSTVSSWPPEAPRIDQVPVNPHEPDQPGAEPPPLPARTRTPPVTSPWAPPSAAEAPADDSPPAPPPSPPVVPTPTPSLPDSRGRPSGTSVDADGTVHDDSNPES